jgi:NAD(+) diphosphatase
MKSLWFVFKQSNLLLEQLDDHTFGIPLSDNPPTAINAQQNVHEMECTPEGIAVKTYAIDDTTTIPATYTFCDLRQSYYKLPNNLYLIAGKCREINYWDAQTKFCGVCGGAMKLHTNISKRCTSCGNEVWPQLATAVIVLIHKGDEVLLVHAKNFKGNFYGLIAGFVETGESLEEAVVREVREETGVEIDSLCYFGSQPWPYPIGLMVGFTARYKSGNLCLQEEELSAGGWFRRERLPQIPEKLSLARKLIDHWLEQFGQ